MVLDMSPLVASAMVLDLVVTAKAVLDSDVAVEVELVIGGLLEIVVPVVVLPRYICAVVLTRVVGITRLESRGVSGSKSPTKSGLERGKAPTTRPRVSRMIMSECIEEDD